MVGGRLQDVRIGTWEWWAVDACAFMAGGPLAGREAAGSPPASSLLLCFFLFPFVLHSPRGCWGLWVSWRRLGELPALNNLAWDPCHALGICSLPLAGYARAHLLWAATYLFNQLFPPAQLCLHTTNRTCMFHSLHLHSHHYSTTMHATTPRARWEVCEHAIRKGKCPKPTLQCHMWSTK